jgi:hypothetical protein
MMEVEETMLATSFNGCQGKGRLAGGEFSELPARAEYVTPSALSNERVEPGVAEDGLKPKDVEFRRALKTTARKFVERNQIDLAPHAFQQVDQPAGIVWVIVDAREQDIFKCQPLVGG